MLKSVCFKNFINFERYQVMDFSNDGPFILIGENASGKSSVLEGIRRCLKLDLNTSMSSVPNLEEMSYFICNAEDVSQPKENVIFGIVTSPINTGQNKEMQKRSEVHATENEIKAQSQNYLYYKFAISKSTHLLIDLIESSSRSDCGTDHRVSKSYKLSDDELSKIIKESNAESPKIKNLFETMVEPAGKENNIETYITSIFGKLHTLSYTPSDTLETLLCTLTDKFVFTFPLRSIGPLQWSKSERIARKHRKENYEEAEKRCEIIKYFLKDKGENFDMNKEQKYFQQLTRSEAYHFKLEDDKISLCTDKFALLKTPEGILEAKAFSILISSRQYKTILLEEPDRGMHPQLVERMIQIMKQESENKKVILTTHQKAFVTPLTVPDIFISRRSEEKTRIISSKFMFAKEKDFSMKDMRLFTSHHIPDILFAKKVLFYKGDSEELFLGELKRQILADESANDELKNSMIDFTFLKLNGKCNRKYCEKLSIKLGLFYIFLLDRDAVENMISKEDKKPESADIKEIWRADRLDLLKRKRIFFWLDGRIEDMVFKDMCMNDHDLKKDLEKQNVYEGDKFLLDKKVTIENVTKSVRLLLEHRKGEHDLTKFINMFTEK